MRKILCCNCCCADGDAENAAEYDSKVDATSDISWSTAQTHKDYVSQQRMSIGTNTLPSIVVTQPSTPSTKVNERMSISEFVDVDFRQGNYEADRFSDMSATIYKRHA